MSLRHQLQSIYDDHGKLTAQIVLDEARAETHPLHDQFEWDNDIAGERWRHQQARELIRSVRVIYKPATEQEPERSVRAFHAVRREDGHVYEPAGTIAHDPVLKQIVLQDMEREWQQLKRRYNEFKEFITMVRRDLDGEAA